VIGGNGSGKTTLAKLLVGLYEPRSGQVRLNGQLVASVECESYRQSFSAVFADFHLFQNLLGIPESARAQAEELLGVLDLRHKVSIDATGRLSTTELSRGQQKRLALLTAYLEDRDVYVFDEWAADQDPAYKDVFYRRLLPELKARGKTVIAITHDDRYYHLADRCLRLELGRIAEDAATSARETA
jgi:putative ATP-binding cassette transporter